MSSYRRFERYKTKGSGNLVYISGLVKSVQESSSGSIRKAVVEVNFPDELRTVTLNLNAFSLSTIDLEAIEKREKETGMDLGYRKAQSIIVGDTIEVLTKRLYTRRVSGKIIRDYTSPIAIVTGRSQQTKISHFKEYAWLLTYLRKAESSIEQKIEEKPKKELQPIEV